MLTIFNKKNNNKNVSDDMLFQIPKTMSKDFFSKNNLAKKIAILKSRHITTSNDSYDQWLEMVDLFETLEFFRKHYTNKSSFQEVRIKTDLKSILEKLTEFSDSYFSADAKAFMNYYFELLQSDMDKLFIQHNIDAKTHASLQFARVDLSAKKLPSIPCLDPSNPEFGPGEFLGSGEYGVVYKLNCIQFLLLKSCERKT